MDLPIRQILPKARDRLPLGSSGLLVSPICLGIVGSPDTVLAAFDAGINFFFITADLHWPQYEPLRRGLAQLLSRGNGIRDELVVAVVSYLEEPLFRHLQFHEVVEAIAGLDRVDVLVAGAVPSLESFQARLVSLQTARQAGHVGSRGIGATFHHRPCALRSLNDECLDIHYIRYNAIHAKAVNDFFPFVRPSRSSLLFSFKSTFPEIVREHGGWSDTDRDRFPSKITDYYRFVLSFRHLDGLLCRLSTPSEVEQLVRALDERPLATDELVRTLSLTRSSSHNQL
jgi:hypothetical protein